MINNVLEYFDRDHPEEWETESKLLELQFGHEFENGDIVVPTYKSGYPITNAENYRYIGRVSKRFGLRAGGELNIYVEGIGLNGYKTIPTHHNDFIVSSSKFVLAPERIWKEYDVKFPHDRLKAYLLTEEKEHENDELFVSLF